MEQTKYTRIRPETMFRVTVERTVKHDSRERMHYEYTHTVEVAPCANDFLALFAALVARHGNRHASFYAPAMGVDERQLTVTLQTLSGAGIRDWTDAHGSAVAEALLRGTNWEVGRVGKAARFSSGVTFSRFFRRTHGCTPQEWRWSNK